MLKIKPLEKDSPRPVYAQIMDSIMEMIDSGQLKYGAKLPTERELAAMAGVSRGTVKKVYGELEKLNIINIVWGSGAYIIKKNSADENTVLTYADRLFERLLEEGFSKGEAADFLNIMHSKVFDSSKVNIAFIDDCPELLASFKKQTSAIKGVGATVFLVEEINRYKNKAAILSEFDMVLVASENYRQLLSMPDNEKIKPLRLYAAPDKQTGINFLKVTDLGNIGILAKSREFRAIVNHNLLERGFHHGEVEAIYDKWTGVDEFDNFIRDKSHLIIPPVDTLSLSPEVHQAMFDFIGNGGSLIVFNYALDKSSLLYIEEIVSRLLYSMN